MASTKILLLSSMFIGIIFIIINIMTEYKNTKPIIKYKYVEKTLEQNENDNEYVSDIFSDMFSKQSVWVFSSSNFDRKKQGEINKYFISQQ